MAFATMDDVVSAAAQSVLMHRTASRTAVAAMLTAVHDLAGNPGAGALSAGNTANGVVPTDATTGFPLINAFGGGATGVLRGVEFNSTVAGQIVLYDRLFHAGAYAFNASTTLASQPSFSGRVPNGTDFTGLELWVEAVTAFTGNLSIAVTYTDQSGNTAHTTGTIATGIAPILGRIIPLPLAAGDSGIQKIESVTATVASAGTFNLVIARRLATMRVRVANDSEKWDFARTSMKQVFDTSAICMAIQPDSTATGLPFALIDIANH